MWGICLLLCLTSTFPSGLYTVDRVEGDLAVLVWRADERIVLHLPAEGVFSPGDIWRLELREEGAIAYPEQATTDLARRKVKGLLARLTDSTFLDAEGDP
mgnify:CR=1 FL=1